MSRYYYKQPEIAKEKLVVRVDVIEPSKGIKHKFIATNDDAKRIITFEHINSS